MKIGAVLYYYPPVFSGAAIQFHRLARQFVADGNDVTIFTAMHPGLNTNDVIDGVNVIRLPIWGTKRLHQQISFMFTLSWSLCQHRQKFDIVHYHSFGPLSSLPTLIAKLLGKRAIYQTTIHGGEPGLIIQHKGGFIASYGLRLLDGYACLSDPLRQNIIDDNPYNKRVAVLPYGVDTTRFFPASTDERERLRSELGLKHDTVYLCFVGSVLQRKGVDILLETFKSIAQKHPHVDLLFIGKDRFVAEGEASNHPNYRAHQIFVDELKADIEAAGLKDRVVFTGLTNCVPEYLRASDIFVFPSRREGLGAVILEAMATGLPCVVAELDGIADQFISNGVDGYVVRSNQAIHYQRFIDVLLVGDAATQMGQMALQKIKGKYTLVQIATQYLDYYAEVLNENSHQ